MRSMSRCQVAQSMRSSSRKGVTSAGMMPRKATSYVTSEGRNPRRAAALLFSRRLRLSRKDRKVAQRELHRLRLHPLQFREQLEQMRAPELQAVLARLIHGAYGIIRERRCALLDVTPQNVRHRLILGELHHAPRAGEVRGKVADVQTSRIEVIAGEQDAGPAIVVRHVRGLMARDRDHVDDALAEIDGA